MVSIKNPIVALMDRLRRSDDERAVHHELGVAGAPEACNDTDELHVQQACGRGRALVGGAGAGRLIGKLQSTRTGAKASMQEPGSA